MASTASTTYVNALYTNLIGFSDPAGATAWADQIDAGTSPYNVANAFLDVYQTTAAPVALLYQAALGRLPDYAGFTFWLNNYKTVSAGNPLLLSKQFYDSAEFAAKVGGDPTTLAASDYVQKLYLNVLGRAGDFDGVNYWTNVLTAAETAGGGTDAAKDAARNELLSVFALSAENVAVNGKSIETYTIYAGINNTAPTADEFTAAAALNELQTVTNVVSTSPNYGATGTAPVPIFLLSVQSDVTTITEGAGATFTVKTNVPLLADATYAITIEGATGSPASPSDFTLPLPTSISLKATESTAQFKINTVANDGVEFTEAFKVTIGTVSSATVSILDGTTDTTAPTFTTKGPFSYAENQVADALVGTVVATDNVAVTKYEITSGNDKGYFALDAATGKITLTAAGVASTANDFDDVGADAANTFTLAVTASDAAGNATKSDVVVNVTNVDDDPPVFTTATVSGTTLVLAYGEALSTTGVPAASAFTGTQDVGGTVSNLNVTGVAISGSTVILTLGSSVPLGATVKIAYTPPETAPLQDAVGNKVAVLPLTTAQTDTVAPTLSSSSPADNATSVAVGDNIVLTFSETVKAGTGNITIVNAADAADTRTISVTDSTQVAFSGTQLTINPTADLKAASNYYVNIANTAITDTIGNKFAGIGDAATLNFATPGGGGTGTTFTLTQGQDTVAGTANDDTINGFLDGGNVTWQSTDKIDGGAGVDTLTALGQTGVLDFTQTTNVEKFVIGTGAAAITGINFANTNAETSLTLQNPTQNVTVTNLNMGATGFDLAVNGDDGGGDTFNFGFSAASTGGANDIVRLGLNGVTTGILVFDNTTEILSITGTGANSKLGASTFSTALKTINVDGSARVDLTNTALAAVTTKVDASASTGGVRINHATNDNTFTFIGSKGNDVLNMGNNWLTLIDTVNGGDGTDTLQINTTALTTANVVNVSGFEILGMNGAALTQDWSLIASKFANRASIDSGHTLTLNNITTGLVVDINATAGTLILGALASPSASDAVTVNLGSSGGGLTLADLQRNADVETLTLNSQGTAANTLTTMSVAMTNLTLTGGTGLTVVGTGTLAGTLDGSAMTGGLTATTSTTALTVLGGKTGDTLTSGNVAAATTQTLSGNEGNDTITATAAATATAVVNINGGAGNDTLTGPGAAAITGTINGGAGIDVIAVGASTGAYVVESNAITVADADIIGGFTTTVEKFKFTGSVVNGSTTTVDTNEVVNAGGGVSLNADLATALASNASAAIYILQGNITGAAATALTNLAGATASTLPALYTTFETELITAIAGTVAGLDTVLATTDKVLMAFDDGTHTALVYVTNTDQAVANTLLASEIELVGVFNTAANLVAADFT